jgi:uracil-DNA glycosylase family 4
MSWSRIASQQPAKAGSSQPCAVGWVACAHTHPRSRQIAAIAPEFICCLGTSAAQSLLRTEETIGKLRGRWFEHGAATVICTYHPSYLLRNPAAKRDVWDDMQRLMTRMGIDMPRKGPGG